MKHEIDPSELYKKQLRDLNRDFKSLLRENEGLRKSIENAKGIQSHSNKHAIPRIASNSKGSVTPIILASDWHMEEEVKKSTVNSLNEYNLKIAEKRAHEFFQNAARLIEKERYSSKVDTIVLALLGDFISGNIHDVLLPICRLQPMDAILFAQEIIISGIEFLEKETKCRIILPCTVGNHSRITPKVWVATENGYSLEFLMYNSIATYFKNKENIQFHISGGQHQYLKLYGKTLRFQHGTHFKYNGGIGGFTVSVNRSIMRTQKFIPAFYDFFGHLHFMEHKMGQFLANGSLIGYNTYALAHAFDYQRPMQAFGLLDEKRGFTGVFPILFSV